eukprot:7591565-Pyramimonas_sp.AAC.1
MARELGRHWGSVFKAKGVNSCGNGSPRMPNIVRRMVPLMLAWPTCGSRGVTRGAPSVARTTPRRGQTAP